MLARRKRTGIAALSGALLASATLVAPSPAAAQSPPPNHPGWAFGHPGAEALFVLAAGLSNATALIPQRATAWGPDAPHPHDPLADRISDFTGGYGGTALGVAAGLGLEAGYFGEGGVRGGVVYVQRSALVEIEALLFTSGTVNALKRLTGRCRPHEFVSGACTTDVRDAFPSGHTAPMGALAGARLVVAAQSTGAAGYRWGSFALGETMALATAWLRVRAGKHSWSDVGAGLVIGHAIGALVALAHPMIPVDQGDLRAASGERSRAPAGDIGQGGLGLSWSGTF